MYAKVAPDDIREKHPDIMEGEFNGTLRELVDACLDIMMVPEITFKPLELYIQNPGQRPL